MSASKWEATLAQQLEAADLLGADREVKFLPDRRFRFDLGFVRFKIGIEVEGGTFVQGRHSRPLSMAKDMEKYNLAAIDGWLVIRVTPHQIKSGEALRWIEAALKARAA